MEYAIDDLLDEDKSYAHLVQYFHPEGLCCPHCRSAQRRMQHGRRRPIVQWKCKDCGTYYNVFTGTVFQGTHWPCSKVVLVLRGLAKGESTRSMSQEMGLGYRNLLYLRHKMMENAFEHREREILEDEATESDEMYQNAGEKGRRHADPHDPPRCRANKKKGAG